MASTESRSLSKDDPMAIAYHHGPREIRTEEGGVLSHSPSRTSFGLASAEYALQPTRKATKEKVGEQGFQNKNSTFGEAFVKKDIDIFCGSNLVVLGASCTKRKNKIGESHPP